MTVEEDLGRVVLGLVRARTSRLGGTRLTTTPVDLRELELEEGIDRLEVVGLDGEDLLRGTRRFRRGIEGEECEHAGLVYPSRFFRRPLFSRFLLRSVIPS